MSTYQGQVTAEAADYLAARGLTPPTVLDAQIGYVAKPLPGHEAYRGKLVFPYHADTGPVSLRFHCIADHDHKALNHGKYMWLAGEDIRLYFPPKNPPSTGSIHVTEGEFDALTLAQCGLRAAGVSGAEAWFPDFVNLLERYQRVFVWTDPDKAGRKLAKTIGRDLRQAEVVPLTTTDVNDTFQAGGAAAVLAHLKDLIGDDELEQLQAAHTAGQAA